MEFAAILRKSAHQFGDATAVTFEGRNQTFAELYERACRLANALADLGVRKGDRVATLGDNLFESIEIFGGLAAAGAVRCQLYTQSNADTHVYMLNLVGAKALIVEDVYLNELHGRLKEVPTLERVIVVGSDAPAESLGYDTLLQVAASDGPRVTVAEDDDHIIRFSAGTTGRPKAILHTTRGWHSVGTEFRAVVPRLDTDDAFLVAGPLTHASQLYVWPCIAAGARSVVMPSFDAGRFLELVEAERCTMTLLVPTTIQLVATHPDATTRDVSSLRAVLYGAAPIAVRTLAEAHDVWGNIMHQLYGQSECLPITVLSAKDHEVDDPAQLKTRLRSAGRATPNTRIKIVDDDGVEVPAGEIGEVLANSPGRMKEIWGDPGATSSRFVDGFVRTRDMGYLDEDGFLFLADRKDDMIISGGYNIWPAEVENALMAHAAVREAAVVGVPHEKWGETVCGVVVLREGMTATEPELIAWCRDEIGSVKKPTIVKFSAEPLPKSSVGKLLRRTVRMQHWADQDREISGA
jgi:acyl-CoA synthetase (AMP-forming)/AMP-acid ligase II